MKETLLLGSHKDKPCYQLRLVASPSEEKPCYQFLDTDVLFKADISFHVTFSGEPGKDQRSRRGPVRTRTSPAFASVDTLKSDGLAESEQ